MFKIKSKKGIEFTLTKLIVIILVIVFILWMLLFYFDIKDVLYEQANNFWGIFG